ncbi:hypothetical protein M430DRAFT_14368 [Amorphotheca resinae ATCC 22711]|uniref:Putative lipoate-protein ligase A n=1 Tax=Amorphotheca resinae ATCC 22711 TaxID=857342 RepID=A0A2T3BCG9_AMORE|nr:hypothetical protein M430DRAFT_14368 [Amorphotheca resinae ATCC 22711]PSS27062.1 hypothetical protein M430DRAFT_14368 [Amorphotheca resinae ATCC 22711]
MAPARRLNSLLKGRLCTNHSCIRRYSDFVRAATDSSNKSQIYISRSLDPYLNLSIEHYLLQKTPADSTVLFLYTNRPSIVIGRNQNPWLEVNLGLLRNDPLGVELVRRRSGGGTVFHDEGNVNYSVICPTLAFNRDKHAEMVVRALRGLGVDRALVNERHDIVLGNVPAPGDARPLKISGSAYKLTRLRSLHHGTCLLSSPNIRKIGAFLKSPAKPFIKARGVDSVSSPITNVNVPNTAFEQAVVSEFRDLYTGGELILVTEEAKDVPEIRKGFDELTSLDWIYSQTPQFTFSTHATEEDPRERPQLPGDLTDFQFRASFTVRNGSISKASFGFGGTSPVKDVDGVDGGLINKKLQEIESWRGVLSNLALPGMRSTLGSAGTFMDTLFGNGDRISTDVAKDFSRLERGAQSD